VYVARLVGGRDYDLCMSSLVGGVRYPAPPLVSRADIGAKGTMLVLLGLAVVFPGFGHLEGKGAGARAVGYPLLAFAVPTVWYVFWRSRASFPWTADLMITFTCFSDVLGNRMNLYDSIEWFDNLMHFVNTGLLSAAVILLTMHRSSTLAAVVERGLAFGVTAALAWELAEYVAFLRWSPERLGAYADTLSDMTLGALGSVAAAVVVHALWQQGRLALTAPQLERQGPELAQA
jgi:hypothetical protein